MTDELTPEETEAREARRQALIEKAKTASAAMEGYEKARQRHELAVEKEKKRAKKEQERIKDLLKESYDAHVPVQEASDARRELISEFVDRDLVRARDRANTMHSRQARVWRKAKAAADEQRALVERRSQKTVIGTLRDVNGRPIPEDPNATFSKPKKGPVRNPRRFKSDEEKAHFEAILRQLEEVEEAERKSMDRLKDVLDKAQEALDAEVERAWS